MSKQCKLEKMQSFLVQATSNFKDTNAPQMFNDENYLVRTITGIYAMGNTYFVQTFNEKSLFKI